MSNLQVRQEPEQYLKDLVSLCEGHAAQLNVGAGGDVAAAAVQLGNGVTQPPQLLRRQLAIGHLQSCILSELPQGCITAMPLLEPSGRVSMPALLCIATSDRCLVHSILSAMVCLTGSAFWEIDPP